MRIKTNRKLLINGETVYPGSIRDLDDITARKLLDRGYAVAAEVSDEEQEVEEEDGSASE